MSTYIDLDSSYRKTDTYTNPASYVVESDQISLWNRAPRQVTANSTRQKVRTLEFAESVEVKHFILPYTQFSYVKNDGTVVNSHIADLQRVYLDVHSVRYADTRLITTINSVIPKARFVLTPHRIQYDSNNNPIWIEYETKMDQVLRFSRNEPIVIEIMQEEGYTIIISDTVPITKSKQTYILLELTPYMIDGGYTNSDIQLTQF
jgi:hypothetical protein